MKCDEHIGLLFLMECSNMCSDLIYNFEQYSLVHLCPFLRTFSCEHLKDIEQGLLDFIYPVPSTVMAYYQQQQNTS